MLGELIAQLDRPDVAAGVLTTLDPRIARQLERRADAASMTWRILPQVRFANSSNMPTMICGFSCLRSFESLTIRASPRCRPF